MAETVSVGGVRALPASAALSDHDVYLLREGTHTRLYEKLGFASQGIRRGYYTDNREDALIMWKDPLPGSFPDQ